MDPNNNVSSQVPESTPVAETPVQPFQPVVVAPMEPAALEPVIEPVVENPVFTQPVMQPVVSEPAVVEQQPQPVVPVVANKSSTKLFIIIGAVVLLLVGTGLALWMFVFSGMPLTKYDNNKGGYSIMAPTAYTKIESGKDVTFTNPKTADTDKNSLVEVSYLNMGVGSKDLFISMVGSRYTKENMENSSGSVGDSDSNKNVIINKTTKDGYEVWTASGDAMSGDKLVGKFNTKMVFNDDNGYGVKVEAFATDADLMASASKIVDSFTVK